MYKIYKIKIIENKDTWNNFILNNNFKFYSFLCGWEWWEVQRLNSKKIYRYWIYNDNKTLIWILALIKNVAKRWTYLFSPHSPLIIESYNYFEILSSIKDNLKKIAEKEKANFIRFNSPVENTIRNKKLFKKLGFINAPMHEHAEDTHLLDLTKNEEDILINMKKGDRYYINRAKKEWVEIRIDNKDDHIDTLINMHNKHAKKVGYSKFDKDFIFNLYHIFWNDIKTISASYEWKVESILMTIKFWKTCVYYIAASEVLHPKFSPNYLCQWSAIQEAKKSWCEVYNFWWVSPDNNPKHPIAWVTKFKRKFAWKDYSLLHAQDLIISQKYWFNWIIETLRRIKRGYYYKKPE